MALRKFVVPILTICSLFAALPSPASAICVGDCSSDNSVSVDEIIRMVNIALGEKPIAECPSGDGDGDGRVQVNDLVTAIANALAGCGEPRFKTSLAHPEDAYLVGSGAISLRWAKFVIRVDDPDTVYFQNGNDYPFHNDFISAVLPGYTGWTDAEIDAVTLHADGQRLVLGAVLYSPEPLTEVALQLVRQDAYTVEETIRYFETVRASVRAAEGVPFFYFPTFEQEAGARANQAALEAAGIRLGSTARWASGDECYNMGWAYGRLVYVPGNEIADAYATGTLLPSDILMTDGVPAEIPFVAGVLSLSPSTPSSHVAILAGDWDIPFAFVADEEQAEHIQALAGREVVVRATIPNFPIFTAGGVTDDSQCHVRVADVTDTLDQAAREYLTSLKQAPELQLRAMQPAGSIAAEVSTATPDDIVRIGGKAANYGFLLRAVPQNTRPAIAFTFDLWNAFLDQPIDGTTTLRSRIAELLAPFPSYPPSDFGALFDALGQIRDLIDDTADFTDDQKTAIVAALGRFDPNLPIRFRSSTNVEDSDVFTGAGLYESESGCLADDLDSDTAGPSLCDSTRPRERGVFRALRKVYASFYNDNAFLERLRHRVDETTVGMAVLVNRTFLDPSELANGVAVLRVRGVDSADATIVSQPGAYSVTNPEDDGVPEVVDVAIFSFGTYPNLRQSAGRVQLGATVLSMPDEYVELVALMRRAGDAFGAFHGEASYEIEFEWKKVAGEGLELKQVRRLPKSAVAEIAHPILIPQPTELCTFQGEFGDIFSNYRLKTRMQPVFRGGEMGDQPALIDGRHSFVLGGAIEELAGPPSGWPGASFETFDPGVGRVDGFRYAWNVGSGTARRQMSLSVLAPAGIVFPDDLQYILTAIYDSGVVYREFDGTTQTRREEQAILSVCTDVGETLPGSILNTRRVDGATLSADIGFYWPPFPSGAVAGYTAPLVSWTGTTVRGIGTSDAVLRGFFSQTYRPEHHNFSENFLFDPHLEQDIDPTVLAAWDAADIQALIVPSDLNSTPLLALTRSGGLRELESATIGN